MTLPSTHFAGEKIKKLAKIFQTPHQTDIGKISYLNKNLVISMTLNMSADTPKKYFVSVFVSIFSSSL